MIHLLQGGKFFIIHIYLQPKQTHFPLVGWIWIELHCFSPDELFDVLFSAGWLLKIKMEGPGTDGLIIVIMKGRQVWVTKCLVNCKQIKNRNQEKWTHNMILYFEMKLLKIWTHFSYR